MKRTIVVAACAVVSVALSSVLVGTPGCGGGGFLGLQDYQRDLIFGGVAAALLNQQARQEAPTVTEPVGQPVPGPAGANGLSCWDLNGNGQGDAAEDVNGDGVYDARDCQGLVGPAGQSGGDGADGAPGAQGPRGADGVNCWDLNGNGAGDPGEDTNGDGVFDAWDCQGPAGPAGPAGPGGGSGQEGPAFFDVFVDDFFAGYVEAGLRVVLVRLDTPVLGSHDNVRIASEQSDAVGYRMAIPPSYGPGNDVTMRLFLYRTGSADDGCFIFTVDARRLYDGSGVEVYDHAGCDAETEGCGRRWVRVEAADAPEGIAAGEEIDDGVLVVVDLPVNSPGGLDYPDDLSAGDFLAFELATAATDGRSYQLLGVEFFESLASELTNATVFLDDPIVDCNGNSIPDSCDIANGNSEDCNDNGIPDECEGVLQIVFDNQDDADNFDFFGIEGPLNQSNYESIFDVLGDSFGEEITVPDGREFPPFDCDPCTNGESVPPFGLFLDNPHFTLNANLADGGDYEAGGTFHLYRTTDRGNEVSGSIGSFCATLTPNDEGPGGSFTAQFDLNPTNQGFFRNTYSVEGSYDETGRFVGKGFKDGGGPREWDIYLAGTFLQEDDCLSTRDCNQNGVSDDLDIEEQTSPDCNENGIPDECEIDYGSEAEGGPFFCNGPGQCPKECSPDCNANGIPDECELSENDCNRNSILDMCEVCSDEGRQWGCLPDCNHNSIPDGCDIEQGSSDDANGNGIPDECEDGTGECSDDADCDDADACTDDYCDDGQCSSVPVECPEGLICVDGQCVD